MLVEFRLIPAVLDPQINDIACCLCIGKIEGWGRIEFDILGWDANTIRQKFALDVEDFHGKAARLRNTIIKTWIAWFGTITAYNRILCTMVEHGLLEVLGKIIVNDQFAFDNALGAGMSS